MYGFVLCTYEAAAVRFDDYGEFAFGVMSFGCEDTAREEIGTAWVCFELVWLGGRR